MTGDYEVVWKFTVTEAEGPVDAAIRALLAQRRPGSIANVFEVRLHGEPGPGLTVDLAQQKCADCGAAIYAYPVGDDVDWLDSDGYALTCTDETEHVPQEG